jgi:MFS family permease
MAFWAAFIALNTFLLFYLMDVVGLSERHAHRFVGQLSLALGAALMLISIPSGWLTDRLGRKPVLIAASVVAGGGTLVLLVARTLPWLTVAGVIIGLGIGTFLSANWALLTDIVPAAEAAHYLGVANIATAGGSALARLLGGALIDSLNSAFGKTTGYLLMYALAAALFFFSALAALPLPLDKPKLLAR